MKNLKCERCGHEWIRKFEKDPKTCPACRSPFYKKPLTPYWKAVREKNKSNGSE